MNVRGGRGARRLWTAVALALLLVPLVPLTPAQGTGDPWWGPTDRTAPTAGWAVRVPLVVENREEYGLSSPFVAVDVDFGALLVKAGWTNLTIGADKRVRNFTLDVDSIRVVPYNPGFVTGPLEGSATKAVPHTWYSSPFEARKLRESDPVGGLLFQVDDFLTPKEKKYYYVYANPLEYGDMEPVTLDAAAAEARLSERAPLDAFLWGTSGTVYYGFEPEQNGQSNEIIVYPSGFVFGQVKVELAVFDVGRYVNAPATANYPNPATMSFGAPARFHVPANKAFRVTSDSPVIVASIRPSDTTSASGSVAAQDLWGYAPGLNGAFADDTFAVFPFTQPSTTLTLIKASGGTVTVGRCDGGGAQITLSLAEPTKTMTINGNNPWYLCGSGKFLISYGATSVGTGVPFPTHQVPARTGGPSGLSFYTPVEADNGFLRICPESKATVRVVSLQTPNLQIVPEGARSSAPPLTVEPKQVCARTDVPSTSPSHPYEVYSTDEDRYPVDGAPVPFRLVVGARERAVDKQLTRPNLHPYGGLGGVDYYVEGPTALFGHYNDTRITVFEERVRDGDVVVTNRTLPAISRDGFSTVVPSADGTGRMHLVSGKPFSAMPMEPAVLRVHVGGQVSANEINFGYARHLPGRPVTANATLGAAEFRGPLVDVRSETRDGRFDVVATGPGSPVTYRLSVVNLGRWIGGDGLTDTITVSCSTPTGWTVEGCSREFTIASGSAERLNVVVTPPAEGLNQRDIVVEARSKAGGVAATFKLTVSVEVRYGVEMWFDEPGGRKTIDPPKGLSPGGSFAYKVVLKNTGSGIDAFTVKVDRDAAQGWSQELLYNDELLVDPIELTGGEIVNLTFLVKAPNTETGFQNLVSILAQSAGSAQAQAVVNTATRIRPKVDLEMVVTPETRLAEPNETATFNLTVRNKGNDVFRVLFTQDSILPEGWNATLGRAEIDLDPNVNFTLPLTLTPPAGARAGDLATLKIKAEIDTGGAGGRVTGDEVSAVVVVRRIHAIEAAATLDAIAQPGESLLFVLPIENRGNGQDVVELLAGAVDLEGWRVAMTTESLTLGVDELGELPLRIDVPQGTPPGQYNLTFTTRLSRETLQNLSIPVDVKRLARVELVGLDALETTPGRAVQLVYAARNTGNVEGTFAFGADVPAGWNASFSPATARLAPGESLDVAVALNATRDAADGRYRVDLSSALAGDPATLAPLAVRVARPELFIERVDTSGDLRAGELVIVSATVGNRGGIAAQNVSVALVVDGRQVDRTVLARVPQNQTALATLSWVATQSRGSVIVVVDPDDELAQTSREQSAATVSFGSKLPLPMPGLVPLAFALALAVALASWRRRG